MSTKMVEYVEFGTILGQQPGEQKHAIIKCPFPFCKGICHLAEAFALLQRLFLVARFHYSMAIHLWVPTALWIPFFKGAIMFF